MSLRYRYLPLIDAAMMSLQFVDLGALF
jgi:hypothetical protein